MTSKEIRTELKGIYKEMDRWSYLNRFIKKPLPNEEVRRRELILWKQQILYQIEDAKLLKDKKTEAFNTELLNLTDRYLKEMRNSLDITDF